jgi:hypothetical protein
MPTVRPNAVAVNNGAEDLSLPSSGKRTLSAGSPASNPAPYSHKPLSYLNAAGKCLCMGSMEWGVLVAIVLRSDNATGQCDPSIEWISNYAHMSYDAACDAIRGLERSGWLRVERRRLAGHTRQETNLYTLLLPQHTPLTCEACADEEAVREARAARAAAKSSPSSRRGPKSHPYSDGSRFAGPAHSQLKPNRLTAGDQICSRSEIGSASTDLRARSVSANSSVEEAPTTAKSQRADALPLPMSSGSPVLAILLSHKIFSDIESADHTVPPGGLARIANAIEGTMMGSGLSLPLVEKGLAELAARFQDDFTASTLLPPLRDLSKRARWALANELTRSKAMPKNADGSGPLSSRGGSAAHGKDHLSEDAARVLRYYIAKRSAVTGKKPYETPEQAPWADKRDAQQVWNDAEGMASTCSTAEVCKYHVDRLFEETGKLAAEGFPLGKLKFMVSAYGSPAQADASLPEGAVRGVGGQVYVRVAEPPAAVEEIIKSVPVRAPVAIPAFFLALGAELQGNAKKPPSSRNAVATLAEIVKENS